MTLSSINPHLGFNGNCKEAFAFYAEVLGGEITFMMTNGESPMKDQMPPETHDNVIHATLMVNGYAIMGGDAPPSMYRPPVGSCTNLQFADVAEAKRVFHALREGGSDVMPWGETFWTKGFGMCVDRFDQHWMINTGELL